MAAERLADLDDDKLSTYSDRSFDQESLTELELLDLSQQDGHLLAQNSRAAQAAKALEIAEERSLPPSGPASPLPWDDHFGVASGCAREASSSAPDTAAAPPDYLSAIASDGAQAAVERSWIESMPQSMSDTGLLTQDRVERGDIYDSPERDLANQLGLVASQTWRIFTQYIKTVQEKRGRKFGLTKRVVRFTIAALVVIILLAILLPIIIRAIIDHRRELEWEREEHPFRDHPAYKRDPRKDHPSTDQCEFDVFSEYEEHYNEHYFGRGYGYREPAEDVFDFKLLDQVDTALPPDFTDPKISGTVEIISIPYRNPWSHPEITIRSNVATTRPWQIDHSMVTYVDNTVTLQSPSLKKGQGRSAKIGVGRTYDRDQDSTGATNNCLDVWIGIYIPVGMAVGNWTTLLRSLSFVDHRNYVFNPDEDTPNDQQVRNGVIEVTNGTLIKSNQGSIDISYWNSRQTTLETRRGYVRGKYTFYDSLSVKTLGGEVDIEIDPLGGALSRDKSHPLKLATSTGSGNTTVTVLPPSGQDWTPHFMESMHRTTSGSMLLRYPAEFDGTIDGVTASGHAEVKGKNIHHNDDSLEGPGEVHMIKGKAADWAGTLGRIDLESESGSIDIVIGDVTEP